MDSNYIYFVPAQHLRAVPDSELTPISPDVPSEEKLIVVSIPEQTLTAYEGNSIVMQTKIASGVPRQSIPGQISTDTPKGNDFHVSSKMPSKHMGNGILFSDKVDANGVPVYEYEIPGVPWTTFFEPKTGVAFHGTYWHTNYGTPMSHGCVNMRLEESKWIFRWTTPVWEPGVWEKRGYGTRVIVR
jgi:lipoprotein-anchoring transpeptidase ErfK/SrfK